MTTILIIIGLIIFVVFLWNIKEKPTPPTIPSKNINPNIKSKNQNELKEELIKNVLKNIKIEITTTGIVTKPTDSSVIDVTGKTYQLIENTNLRKYSQGVPFWAHQYVYSYTEINYATSEQKAFYDFYKKRFLDGEYYDIDSNSNYAFILLFDLLNEYENHKDITKLEQQLEVLGHYYPKTKSYGISFLLKKMEFIGDTAGISRLGQQNRSEYRQHYSDYDYWTLGTKYKTKLKLNKDEVALLNKLSNPNNNFFNIEYCAIEVLRLFLNLIKELKNKYALEGTALDQQFEIVTDIIARKHYKYRKGSNNHKYCLESSKTEIYSNLLKYCENAVRDLYGHKRKISADFYSDNQFIKDEYEPRISSKILELLPTLTLKINLPDEKTEIELNTQNTSRWKIRFEEIAANYSKEPKQFVEQVILLGRLNTKNPSVENIFYEASKFISKFDKESSLTLYIYYLHYDLKSTAFDNKQLSKTIQKSLFDTNEQLHSFEKIVSDLINDKELEKALLGVSKIYIGKKKKIQLNISSIKEVQKQHQGTVELLNEYLKDEYDDESNTIKSQEINDEELKIDITQKGKAIEYSAFNSGILLSQIHQTTLEMFAKNNYAIVQNELEVFSKSNGVFKNQLIESINDRCYDYLDDVLIEEEDEYYTINPNYYERILANDQQH